VMLKTQILTNHFISSTGYGTDRTTSCQNKQEE
jgi:hypothetical protein